MLQIHRGFNLKLQLNKSADGPPHPPAAAPPVPKRGLRGLPEIDVRQQQEHALQRVPRLPPHQVHV